MRGETRHSPGRKQSRANSKVLQDSFFSLSKLMLFQIYGTSKLTQIK